MRRPPDTPSPAASSPDPSDPRVPLAFVKGRGSNSNAQSRFDRLRREPDPDAAEAALAHRWSEAPAPDPDSRSVAPMAPQGPACGAEASAMPAPPATVVLPQRAVRVLSANDSPDLPFDRSLNPYLGCEHGCSYCYARPSHAHWGLSPGLDFETRIFAKTNAAEALRAELSARGYACAPIALGANTDPYQPAERDHRVTRSVLETLEACSHPVTIVTKNALVERDLDLLATMARRRLVHVYLSVTTWDHALSARLEPRASAPHRRVAAIGRLAAAGVPVGVMVAPIIPGLTDRFIETILARAREAGASAAHWVLLRLPREVAPLFEQWLRTHQPLRAAHVMSLVRQTRGGRAYDARFGARQTGTGPHAASIAQRFEVAARRLGYAAGRLPALDTTAFRPPHDDGPQLDLF